MLRWSLIVTATLAVVASGLVHGFWTDRWRPSVATAEAVARLEGVPLDLGGWRGHRDDKPAPTGAGVAGSLQRTYVNGKGQVVKMALLCGRPGPLSVHTPVACYGGSGYTVDAPVRAPVGLG